MAGSVMRDVGDGLVLRRSTPADAEALAAFNGAIFREAGAAGWTRDLLSRPHPTFGVGDFTIVEDARTGAIVSSLNLISQTWSYDGIRFGVGRPELVGTKPEYRQRGLVRVQFEEIHRWSAERGEAVQAITGIPYFYRQFGYEMGLSLDAGRAGTRGDVPRLKDGETEPFRVRPATAGDLPFIARVYQESATRYRVACVRDEALWKYELDGRSAENGSRFQLGVIEAGDGESVGYLAHRGDLASGRAVVVRSYELRHGVSWLAVTPSIFRYLDQSGEEYARQDGKGEYSAISFQLGMEHPVYQALGSRLPRSLPPYAWYVRVADLPGFLRLVTPALERRLAESIAVGHSGELKI
ncbi:MAG TPA: GNAT family N-acetyltransferase, partial [Chloroflexota bacterium]|nr:GNAT family N-acetyltransferase [Chloroflexota bacterium]